MMKDHPPPTQEERAAVRAAAAGESPPAKRRRWWRRRGVILSLAGVAVLVLAVFVGLIPPLLSTSSGTSWLMARLSDRLPGRVDAGELSLSWLAGQQAERLELWDPEGGSVATMEEVELSERGLAQLLWNQLTGRDADLGSLRVEGGRVTLRRDASGRVNLDRALGTQWFDRVAEGDTPPSGKVTAQQGSAENFEVLSVAQTSPPQERQEREARGSEAPVLPESLHLQLVVRDVVVAWEEAPPPAETRAPAGPQPRATHEHIIVDVPAATFSAAGPSRLGVTFEAEVSRYTISPASEAEHPVDRGQVQLTAVIDDLFNVAGRWSAADSSFAVEGEVHTLPLSAIDRFTGRSDYWTTIIGPTLDARLSMDGPVHDLAAQLSVDSRRLHVNQALQLGPAGVAAAPESRMTLELTPSSWDALTCGAAGQLLASTRLQAAVQQLDAPANAAGTGLDLAATTYRAVLEPVDDQPLRLKLPDRPTLSVVPHFTISSSRADAHVTLDTLIQLAVGSEQEALVAGLRVDFAASAPSLSGNSASSSDGIVITGRIDRLPVGLLDWAGRQGDRLVTTLGQSMALDVLAVADGDDSYGLTVDFGRGSTAPGDLHVQRGATVGETSHSSNSAAAPLTGRLTGGYRDGAVTLSTDERLSLTLSPPAFGQWMRPVAEVADMGESVGVSLPAPATVTADLDLSVALRDSPGLRFDPTRTRLTAAVQLPETVLVDEWYHRRFALRDGSIRIDASDLREPILLAVALRTGDVAGQASTTDSPIAQRLPDDASGAVVADPEGRLEAQARLTGLMLDDGYVQLQRGRISATIELMRLPTVIFDTLTRQRGYAVAAFGEKLDATVQLDEWNFAEGGGLRFEFQSENQSLASFSGRDVGGMFVPDRPMTFYFNQTPALAGKIMRWVNPVLLPAVRSATVPFTLTIDDDNFRFPTRDFSLTGLNADVQVQMGTVRIDPSIDPVHRIVTPLQKLNVIQPQLSYDARVSPIALRLRDGVLSYDTLRFRIDDVDLSFGGTVSLVDQVVDMQLHLGGRAIERDPLIRTLLAGGIDIGGTVQKPEVDLNAMLAELKQQRIPEAVGGLLGDLLQRELQKQRQRKQDQQQ